MKLLFVTVCALVAVASAERYDGYSLMRAIPSTQAQLEALRGLEGQGFFVDFWAHPSKIGKPVDFLVKPVLITPLMVHLNYHGVNTVVKVDDIQPLLDLEADMVRGFQKYVKGSPKSFTVDQYHSSVEIGDFMKDLAAQNDFVEFESIGKSFEKRDLNLVKIGKKGTNKPGFWLDCGIHAREWLSPSTCVWIINDLVTKYKANDAETVALLDGIDFFIMPNLNVDGYEFTRSDSRLWRKTRSGPYQSGFSKCYGVDPNRNWDAQWGGAGASSSPCSETYRGPSVFSEVENKLASDYILARKDTMQCYFSIHTFSQLWMYPWSYKSNTYPDDIQDYLDVSKKAVSAIKAVHGKSYQSGTPADILYSVTGGSHDWAKEVGIKWSFTMELRPSGGFNGFVQPASQIVPTAEETWAGIKVVADRILTDRQKH